MMDKEDDLMEWFDVYIGSVESGPSVVHGVGDFPQAGFEDEVKSQVSAPPEDLPPSPSDSHHEDDWFLYFIDDSIGIVIVLSWANPFCFC